MPSARQNAAGNRDLRYLVISHCFTRSTFQQGQVNGALRCNLRPERTAAARQPNTRSNCAEGPGRGRGRPGFLLFKERACCLALVLNLSFSAVYSRQVYQPVDQAGPAHTTPLLRQLHPQGSPRVKSLTSVLPFYFAVSGEPAWVQHPEVDFAGCSWAPYVTSLNWFPHLSELVSSSVKWRLLYLPFSDKGLGLIR